MASLPCQSYKIQMIIPSPSLHRREDWPRLIMEFSGANMCIALALPAAHSCLSDHSVSSEWCTYLWLTISSPETNSCNYYTFLLKSYVTHFIGSQFIVCCYGDCSYSTINLFSARPIIRILIICMNEYKSWVRLALLDQTKYPSNPFLLPAMTGPMSWDAPKQNIMEISILLHFSHYLVPNL